MPESPATRATLLMRLRNGEDHQAWSEFLRDYGPMLYRFVRGRGIQDADTADILQEVFRKVGSAIGRLEYEKEKGGFRAWLFKITRNTLYNYFEKRERIGPVGNDSDQFEMLSQAADDRNELTEQWEQEHMRQLAAQAIEIVRRDVDPSTWQAFRLTAIEGQSAAEAGHQLDMSTGAVYVAKSRVTARLRAEIRRMQLEEN